MELNNTFRQFFQCCVCLNAGFAKYKRCNGPEIQHVHCSDCAEKSSPKCSACGDVRTFNEDRLLANMSALLTFKCHYASCKFEDFLTEHGRHRISCLGMVGGVCPCCYFEAATTRALTRHILSSCLHTYPCYRFSATEGRSDHFTLDSPSSPIAVTDGYYWLRAESIDHGDTPHLLRLEVATVYCPASYVITVVYMGSAKYSRNLSLRLTLQSSAEDELKISREYRVPNCRIRWPELLKHQFGLTARECTISGFQEIVLNADEDGVQNAFRLQLELTDHGLEGGADHQVACPKKRRRPLDNGTSTTTQEQGH